MKRQVCIKLPEDLHALMRADADADHGGSLTAAVSGAVMVYLRFKYGESDIPREAWADYQKSLERIG